MKAPSMFAVRTAGKTIINRTQGNSKIFLYPPQLFAMCSLCSPCRHEISSPYFLLLCRVLFVEIASEGLKGRVFEMSLADLNGGDESQGFRKIKLVVEDVQGNDCLTTFHGMDMARDKLCSLIRKWQTLIEAYVDVRTTDGYYLRLFAIAFTRKQSNQAVKSTCYAQAGQVRNIRKKMFEIMTEEASKCDLKELVQKL